MSMGLVKFWTRFLLPIPGANTPETSPEI